MPILPPADMMRVLITSTGEQIVVATNPAASEEMKCVPMLSGMWKRWIMPCLNVSYEASCDEVINSARALLGQMPRVMDAGPSSLIMRNKPSNACL